MFSILILLNVNKFDCLMRIYISLTNDEILFRLYMMECLIHLNGISVLYSVNKFRYISLTYAECNVLVRFIVTK